MATEAVPTRTLNVEVISASGLKDTEFIGKSDPYVLLSVGKTHKKTKVAKDQPTSPVWNESLSLPVLDTDTELVVSIKNDDTLGRDEEMGRTVLPFSFISGGGHSGSDFPLELKGKPHGVIVLSLSFEGEGHEGHHVDHVDHGLAEQVEGLNVADEPEPFKDESVWEPEKSEVAIAEGSHEAHHGGLKEKVEEFKEKRRRKKEKKHDEEGHSSSESESDKD